MVFDNRGNYDKSENLTKNRSGIQQYELSAKSKFGNNGTVLNAQIVRTLIVRGKRYYEGLFKKH